MMSGQNRRTSKRPLSAYEARWNGRLLGGRAEELAELHLLLDESQTVEPPPSRALENLESPISETVPADILAGAPPRMAVTIPIPAPVHPAPPVVAAAPKDVIVQPRVRRNSSPSYPRSAKRRNISAIVVVAMNINEKGRVKSVDTINVEPHVIRKSSGAPLNAPQNAHASIQKP